MKCFKEWMWEVNDNIERVAGLSYKDIPDYPYHDMFDDGYDPRDAAMEALNAAGYDVEEEIRIEIAEISREDAAYQKAYLLAYGSEYESED